MNLENISILLENCFNYTGLFILFLHIHPSLDIKNWFRMKAHVLFLSFLFGFILIIVCGCEKDDYGNKQFIDSRDGNVYRTVRIGDQEWMAENLRFIPNLVSPDSNSRVSSCYYVYEYNGVDVNEAKSTANYKGYGVLYNWVAAVESCPKGWHLPRYSEWMKLVDYLGGENIAASKLKKSGTTFWEAPNTGAVNDTGFSALPGGVCSMNGTFNYMGYYGYWWISAEKNEIFGWYMKMSSGFTRVYSDYYRKEVGYSVRCIRDQST